MGTRSQSYSDLAPVMCVLEYWCEVSFNLCCDKLPREQHDLKMQSCSFTSQMRARVGRMQKKSTKFKCRLGQTHFFDSRHLLASSPLSSQPYTQVRSKSCKVFTPDVHQSSCFLVLKNFCRLKHIKKMRPCKDITMS